MHRTDWIKSPALRVHGRSNVQRSVHGPPRRTPAALAAVVALSVAASSGCAVVRPGEVGVKTFLGQLHEEPLPSGPNLYTPVLEQVQIVPVRTVEVRQKLDLPTREGLEVTTEASVLYRVRADTAPQLVRDVGVNYQEVIVLPAFRSVARGVSSRFIAADLYTAERISIERQLHEELSRVLSPRGIEVEQVFLKSIKLPPRLAQSIEDKLRAEQQSQQMQFVLARERQEAERKRIQAEGVRDSQRTIAEGLSDQVLAYYNYEAFKALATSPNAKVVVTNGSTPLLLSGTTETVKR